MYYGGMLVLLWILVCSSVSFTFSSSINSLLTARSILPTEAGENGDLLNSVASGAQMAIGECKNIFKWDRWNCPDSAFSRRMNQPLTKETAYVRAILSAGVVHSITRNCSRGEIKVCGCNVRPGGSGVDFSKFSEPPPTTSDGEKETPVQWSWGGCSEDTKYAEQVAKKFLNSLERGHDVHAYAHLHNNLVGRTIVKMSMERKCRCHGISGSCSVQTCWLKLAPFHQIANDLRERYHKATHITYADDGPGLSIGNSAKSSSSDIILNRSPNTLIYLDESPNYCKVDFRTEWPGTKGRTCSRNRTTTSLPEKRSCKRICRTCGHRVRKVKKTISYKCNCTFQFCCQVNCSTCTETVEEYFCD